jgi:hypothetical protein
MTRDLRSARFAFALSATVCGLVFVVQAQAQNRGVYPLGMSATNSGVTPEPGFSYSNQLLIYSRDKSKGPNGEVLATGSNSVVMDMNTLAWVSKKKILGGAKFSMTATLPVAKNSLTSDFTGPVSGGAGLADSYYQARGRSRGLRFPRSDRELHRRSEQQRRLRLLDTRVLLRSDALSDDRQEDVRFRFSNV